MGGNKGRTKTHSLRRLEFFFELRHPRGLVGCVLLRRVDLGREDSQRLELLPQKTTTTIFVVDEVSKMGVKKKKNREKRRVLCRFGVEKWKKRSVSPSRTCSF